jgi:hypothetical protein
MLKIVAAPPLESTFAFAPATEAVVSWNTRAPSGTLDLRVTRADGRQSRWLPYVTWDERERRSLGGRDEVAAIELDVLRVAGAARGLEVRSSVALDALAVATPPVRVAVDARLATSARPEPHALTLEVPERGQYPSAYPEVRGWCSPAALAMLLGYRGLYFDVAVVADAVRDAAYGGTGNWTFNVAFAGTFGLRGVVAYLSDLAQAERFIAARVPLALSIAWRTGELPGAPLAQSDGHLVVLRGFDDAGDPLLNDPAQPEIGVRYPRADFERAWLEHGGVAYVVAPAGREAELEGYAA